jgi:hypothetical protein
MKLNSFHMKHIVFNESVRQLDTTWKLVTD